MTTKITVDAHAGWPVDVTTIDMQNGNESRTVERVPANETRDVYVHSGRSLHIREVPREGDWTPDRVTRGDFGWALSWLKNGRKVAREGWNGKGMWLVLVPGTPDAELRDGTPYKKALGQERCEILPHIDMWTINASGRRAMLPGWLASQSDMLADDWVIVP